jgi:3-deoxy-manno-octulosonate cytidylyltransferase (CMP-KDO synthetase)
MKKRIVGVIPARLGSTRLPRKPLQILHGHPLIAWVYGNARRATDFNELLIATDSDEIVEWCRSLRIPALLTSPAHHSGTDRILEVMARQTKDGIHADIYVNIQGDEPFVGPEHIKTLLQPFEVAPAERSSTSRISDLGSPKVTTLKVAIKPAEAADPNIVKVVTDSRGRALYFSRSRIPHDQDGSGEPRYYKHLGLYAFSVEALEEFHHWPRGALESAEKLEQLRFLENGVAMTVIETPRDTIGVDTPADLEAAEDYIKHMGLEFPEF